MKPAAATWVTLSDLQLGLFYMHYPTDRIIHTREKDSQTDIKKERKTLILNTASIHHSNERSLVNL